jgi:hypothetical protein
MHADTVVALVSIVVAGIIAVSVPWMTFRLALRQDQSRWLREQRAQLYADLLTEAHAEHDHVLFAIAEDEVRERMRLYFADLRLPPLERARLGARGTIFGSKTVNRLFNRLESECMKATLGPQRDDGQQMMVRVDLGRALDELEAAVRRELGADRIPLDSSAAAEDHLGRKGGASARE